jgi:hypothetical protein
VILVAGLAGLDHFRRAALVLPLADEATLRAHDAPGIAAFRFAANPAVLVLDFGDLASQGRALNRVAALIEKAGLPRERVLDDAELAAAIRATGATEATWYYGHDYAFASLARFYALAAAQGRVLSGDETRLAGLLAAAGAFRPGAVGALITLPRLGADPLVDAAVRATILRHELSHGEYFTDPAYAGFVRQFWRTAMTDAERAAFTRFLVGEDYDPGEQDLIINETQAYLMFTADARFFSAQAVGLPEAEIAALRATFRATMPAGWLRDLAAQ